RSRARLCSRCQVYGWSDASGAVVVVSRLAAVVVEGGGCAPLVQPVSAPARRQRAKVALRRRPAGLRRWPARRLW
ncbi:MAG: hypothetical protein ABSA91_19065, partial [Acidimicrobiales bacterium]